MKRVKSVDIRGQPICEALVNRTRLEFVDTNALVNLGEALAIAAVLRRDSTLARVVIAGVVIAAFGVDPGVKRTAELAPPRLAIVAGGIGPSEADIAARVGNDERAAHAGKVGAGGWVPASAVRLVGDDALVIGGVRAATVRRSTPNTTSG